MSDLKVVSAPNGVVILIPAAARIDAMNARVFRAKSVAAVATAKLVILVLSDVTFIDSTGLGCFISLLKGVPAGGQIRLVDVQPDVGVLLQLTRLDRVFRTFRSVESALAA